jgi:hypothetical protein
MLRMVRLVVDDAEPLTRVDTLVAAPDGLCLCVTDAS